MHNLTLSFWMKYKESESQYNPGLNKRTISDYSNTDGSPDNDTTLNSSLGWRNFAYNFNTAVDWAQIELESEM